MYVRRDLVNIKIKSIYISFKGIVIHIIDIKVKSYLSCTVKSSFNLVIILVILVTLSPPLFYPHRLEFNSIQFMEFYCGVLRYKSTKNLGCTIQVLTSWQKICSVVHPLFLVHEASLVTFLCHPRGSLLRGLRCVWTSTLLVPIIRYKDNRYHNLNKYRGIIILQ